MASILIRSALLAVVAASVLAVPFGQVQNGDFTYYDDAGYGACGQSINAASQNLVAVSYQWFTSANPNNDPGNTSQLRFYRFQ